MKLSRHAKNNLRLYKIAKRDITEAVESPDFTDKEGNALIAIKEFLSKFSGYPLKVIYEKKGGQIKVITAYPLKKKHWG